jgi:ATP-binding cassette, subfamily B, bacterial PglK
LNKDFIRSIQLINKALSKKQRKKFAFAWFLTFLNSTVDILALLLLFRTLTFVVTPGTSFGVIDQWNPISTGTSSDLFLVYMFGTVFLLFAIKNIGSYFSKRFLVNFAFEVSKDLSDQLYSRTLNAPLLEHKHQTTGELNHRINSIAIYFGDFVLLPTMNILSELLLSSLILLSVLFYSTALFGFLVVFILPTAWFIGRYSRKKLKDSGATINKYTPKLISNTQKLVNGFVELKLAGNEENIREEFDEIRSTIHKNRKKIYIHHSVIHTHFMETMVVFGVLALSVLTYRFSSLGALSGILVLFGTMSFRLIPSINRIITNSNTLRTFSHVLDMIIFDKNKEQEATSERPVQFSQSIELSNVSFNFENGANVIDALNLNLEKHQKIGIFGESGGGKTTLINLLMGFYQASEGELKVDGRVIDEAALSSWRQQIGYVRQDSYMSTGTILENVAFGYAPNQIDSEKVKKCLAGAKLLPWVNSLEKGVHSEIGELGTRISGGQKQRIAIARMLYKDAELFILDEITNSLDPNTSKDILDTVYQLNNSRATIVMISHQPKEFYACDKTYRLLSGKLVAHNEE